MEGLIKSVGMVKSKMYVNKVGMGNSKDKEKNKPLPFNHTYTCISRATLSLALSDMGIYV